MPAAGDAVGDPRADVTDATSRKRTVHAGHRCRRSRRWSTTSASEVGELRRARATCPPAQTRNVRNDMYLVSEALRAHGKNEQPQLTAAEHGDARSTTRGSIDNATKFIPTWVKVAVAIALGLGTMVGWKRIVVTVGEKIGKTHLTYAQGAAGRARRHGDHRRRRRFGLPVSTTHVLSRASPAPWRRTARACNGHGAQHAHGLGADPAGLDRARRRAVLDFPSDLLVRAARGVRRSPRPRALSPSFPRAAHRSDSDPPPRSVQSPPSRNSRVPARADTTSPLSAAVSATARRGRSLRRGRCKASPPHRRVCSAAPARYGCALSAISISPIYLS